MRGGIGGIVIKVAQVLITFATTTLLARTCGSDGYGVYVFVFAVLQLLGIPAELGTSVLLVREVAACAAKGQWGALRGVIRRSRFVVGGVSVGLGALTLLVALVGAGDPGSHDGRLFATFLAGSALLPLIALTNLHAASLRGLGEIVKGQLPGLIIRPGAFLVLALVASYAGTRGPLSPQLAMRLHAIGAAGAFVVGWMLLARAMPTVVRRAVPEYEMKRWARSSLSLTFIAGLQIINSQTDIVMLGLFRTPDVVGVYRVAVQCSLLVVLGLDIANMVVSPLMSRLYSEGDLVRLQRLTRVSARLVLASAIPVALVFGLFGSWILGRIFGAEYVAGLVPLGILAAGQIVNASAGAVVMLLNMTGREASVARGFVVSGVLNVVLNLAFIPRWGMNGAAAATAICIVVWNLYLCRATARELGISCWAFGPTARGPGSMP